MPLEMVLAEIVLRGVAEVVATMAAGRLASKAPPELARLRDLRRWDAQVAAHEGRTVARMGAAHAHATATFDEASSRLVIECAWSGDGPRLPQTAPHRELPRAFAPLRRLPGAYLVGSNGRTLTLGGGLVLLDHVHAAIASVAGVATAAARMRARLRARGLGLGWGATTDAEGLRITRRTVFARDGAWTFDRDSARVAIANGAAVVDWRHEPSDDEIRAMDDALTARARTHVFR